MNELNQRKAIAKACGYKEFPIPHLNNQQTVLARSQEEALTIFLGQYYWSLTPDYLNSLDACAEFENANITTEETWVVYRDHLSDIVTRDITEQQGSSWRYTVSGLRHICGASAKQRCEAFLKTKGLWKDEVES